MSCLPPALSSSLSSSRSLLTLLIQNTSMNLSNLQRTDDLSSLPAVSTSLFLFLSLLSLYSFPSGYAADEVSLHRTNTTITFPPFFIACPPYSAKLLLRCSSILQMNCLDNLIFFVVPVSSVKRCEGRPVWWLTHNHGWRKKITLCALWGIYLIIYINL